MDNERKRCRNPYCANNPLAKSYDAWAGFLCDSCEAREEREERECVALEAEENQEEEVAE